MRAAVNWAGAGERHIAKIGLLNQYCSSPASQHLPVQSVTSPSVEAQFVLLIDGLRAHKVRDRLHSLPGAIPGPGCNMK